MASSLHTVFNSFFLFFFSINHHHSSRIVVELKGHPVQENTLSNPKGTQQFAVSGISQACMNLVG